MIQHPYSRRQLLSLLGLGTGAAALSACSPFGGAGTDGGAAASSIRSDMKQAPLGDIPAKYKGRTNIVFWAPWVGELYDKLVQLFTRFNDSQTGIFAALESVGGYKDLHTKFTAALQSRAVPDFVCFPEMQWLQFYFAGALAPLDRYFTPEWNLDIYLPNYVGEGKVGDQTYVVPFARSTPLFYYNKTVFAELGLPVAREYTFSQLREFGSKIATKIKSGNPMKTFSYNSGGDAWFASSWLWAFDGQWSDGLQVMPNEDPVNKLMTFAKEWVHTDKFAYLAKAGATDFQTGLVASVQGSTASMRGLTEAVDFELGAAFMPAEVKKPAAVPTGGSGFSLVRTESQERQDATAELFKFLATPQASGWYHVNTGYVPIVKAAVNEPEVKQLHATDPNFTVAIDQLVNAQTAAPVNWFAAGVQALNEAFTSLAGDNTEVKATMDTLRGKYEAVINDQRDDLAKLGVK